MQSSKQRRDFIDVTKFALSILIVVIHISPIESLNPVLRPFLRTAVPLFFLISAYLFFKKYGEAETIEKKIARIERYVKRNLQLYFFWLIVLLIPTLSYRQWFSDGLLSGFFWALHSFLFGSTFIASWYIMASIIATLIIVVASRYLGNKTILLLSAIPYLACCAMSNYGASPLVAPHYDTLCYAFGSNDYNSFWVAIFWIAAGKCIADNELRLSKVNASSLLAIMLVGLGAIYIEQFFILTNQWSYADDCYLGLAIFCIPAFILSLRVNVSCKYAAFLRNASIVTYCLHDNLNYTIMHFTSLSPTPLETFFIVLVASWLLTALIMKMEKNEHLSWLKVFPLTYLAEYFAVGLAPPAAKHKFSCSRKRIDHASRSTHEKPAQCHFALRAQFPLQA